MWNCLPRNSSVDRVEQNPQSDEASGLVRYPPAIEIYCCMYSAHVLPEGGVTVTTSRAEQVILCLPKADETFSARFHTYKQNIP